MPTSAQEKFADSIKTEFSAQQDQWLKFANKALEDSMSLMELNMKATKDSFDKFAQTSQQLFSAKSPQEFFSFDSNGIREEMNRMLSYGSELSSIASNFQGELNQAAQAQLSNSYGMTSKLYEETVNMAPSNSGNPFDLMKAGLENMKEGFEQWTSATRNAVQSIGENVKAMPSGSTSSGKKANKAAHKVNVHD